MGTSCSHQLTPISRGGHIRRTFANNFPVSVERDDSEKQWQKLIHHTNDREEVRFGSCVRFLNAFSYVDSYILPRIVSPPGHNPSKALSLSLSSSPLLLLLLRLPCLLVAKAKDEGALPPPLASRCHPSEATRRALLHLRAAPHRPRRAPAGVVLTLRRTERVGRPSPPRWR